MIEVYSVSVSYVYPFEGSFREHTLCSEYLADSPYEAVLGAKRWAVNRFEDYMLDAYKATEIGCIKVGSKTICYVDERGYIANRYLPFFEWKYGFPMTLDEAIERYRVCHGR